MDPSRAAASTRRDGASPPPPPVFPAGLRVLLVDDDATCLKIVAQMLRKCLYDVTTCSQAAVALGLLRRKKGWFDLVLSDVYMPDMDGFKLLEDIGLEMDLPVIMMSADDHKDVVMKGVTHGACDYIIKPVRMESLKNIWQHVVRKKRNDLRELENSGSLEESDKNKRTSADEGDNASSASGGNGKSEKRQRERKDEDEDEEEEEVLDDHDDPSHSKKPRVVWSAELHQKFLTAVNQLGVDKAVPKKILELMNVVGLTRENVASHLQKYRLYLRRVSVPQNQGIYDAHYTSSNEATYNSVGLVDGFNLQGLGVSALLPPQSLAAIHSGQRIATSSSMVITAVDQLGFINSGMQVTGASDIISSSLQQMNNQRMSILPGRSKNIELSQLGQSQQVIQPHGSIGLQFGEGTSNFLVLPSLASTTLSSPGGTISRQPNKPLNMHMTQHNHGQQFSVFQQRSSTPDISLLGQPQLRGQLLNEISSHNPRLVSSLTQQAPPNNIANHLVGRLGTNANTLTFLPSNYINAPYGSAIPQTLYFDGQTSFTNRSAGNSYPPVSVTADTPQIGSFYSFSNSSCLKGISHVSGFDTIDEHQNGSQDWKLQKVNIPYRSDQTLGLQQSTIDCHASRIGHQDAVAIANNRDNINSGALTEEILSVKNKIDDKTSIAWHNNTNLIENSAVVNYEVTPDICYQNLFLGDNFITNELMNVVQEQRQDGIGQADAEFNIPV